MKAWYSASFFPLAGSRVVQAVDIGQVDHAAGRRAARGILLDNADVPVAAPLRRDDRIAPRRWVEDSPPGEVVLQSLVDREARRDQNEVSGHWRITLEECVEVRPRDRQRHRLGLAAAGRHLEGRSRPCVFRVENAQCRGGEQGTAVLGEDLADLVGPTHLFEIDERLDRLSLAEVVAELHIPIQRRQRGANARTSSAAASASSCSSRGTRSRAIRARGPAACSPLAACSVDGGQ
jgi:hypothetical protein